MGSLRKHGLRGRGWGVALAALMLAACGGGAGESAPTATAPGAVAAAATAVQIKQADKVLEIRTVNNRADLVSDGDALVELVLPERAAFPSLKATLNGEDVSKLFVERADGRVTALLTGLNEGGNLVWAAIGGGKAAELTITNAPRTGPIVSGPHVEPFYCATPTPQIASGSGQAAKPATNASGLSGTPGAKCQIATEFKLYYRTTTAGCTFSIPDPSPSVGVNATSVPPTPAPPANGCFKPYDAAQPRPADMASTTTDAGLNVDYIVRVERGTMNRGIYDLVALFDPSRPWTPTEPQAAWNGKLFYSFGASTGQPRRQSRPATAWPSLDEQIRRGYVVAMNSMTDSSRNSNRVLMSETVMMMKEHVGDAYGPIKFTIGSGCSGGSINSNMNASITPGLLDGVITSCTYPDSETTSIEVGDCTLLVEAYQKTAMLNAWTAAGLTQAQINAHKAAINGHVDQTACHAWYNLFGSNGKAGLYFPRNVLAANNTTGVISQSANLANNCELPNSAVYDPTNPATANLPRCNAWSWAENIWGKVPNSNQARDTRDNVGVQYGLKALRDHVISAEEFVTLNEAIGGIDRDSTPIATRSTADAAALDIAYRSGIVMSGKQVAKTAIIDLRGWDDSILAANVPPGYLGPLGIHHMWFSFAIRDRLIAESDSRDAKNQALWRFSRPTLTGSAAINLQAMNTMDAWLTALKADTSANSLEQKVRTARPASSMDFCYLS
ncbi:MAG: DUF6351 family protein, partial [Ramlibacter sp.]